MSSIESIYRKRDLTRGLNYAKSGRTIDRWVEAGKFPPPDLVLPGNEKAWFQTTVQRWEASRRTGTSGQ